MKSHSVSPYAVIGAVALVFSGVALVALFALGRSLREPVLPWKQVVDQIPAQMQPRYPQYETKENGYPLFLDTCLRAERLVKSSGVNGTAMKGNRAATRQVVRQLTPCFKALRQSLDRRAFVAPVKWAGLSSVDEYPGAMTLARYLVVRAEESLERNRANDAIDDLLLAQRLGERIRKSAVPLRGWLAGGRCELSACMGIQRLLWHRNMDATAIRRLDREFPADESAPETYRECLKVDLYTIGAYDLGTYRTRQTGGGAIYVEDRNAWRLVAENSHPYDRRASIRLLSSIYKAAVNVSSRPWTEQHPTVIPANLMNGWPKRLVDRFRKRSDRYLKWSSLSRAETRDAKSALASETNPYGRCLVQMLTVDLDDSLRAPFWYLGLNRATRILLKIRVYALDHAGAMPPAVAPLPDPFGRGPIHYDAKRRRIWSVGSDGKDDGGQDSKLHSRNATDIIWHIGPE